MELTNQSPKKYRVNEYLENGFLKFIFYLETVCILSGMVIDVGGREGYVILKIKQKG